MELKYSTWYRLKWNGEWHSRLFCDVTFSAINTRATPLARASKNQSKRDINYVADANHKYSTSRGSRRDGNIRLQSSRATSWLVLTLIILLTRPRDKTNSPDLGTCRSRPRIRLTSTIRENWIHACYSRYWVSRYARYPNSSNSVYQPGRTPALAHGTSASSKGNALTILSSSQSSNFCTKSIPSTT